MVAPSNAYDAKGLMAAAIRDPNPVIFMFHKALQGMGWLGTEKDAIVDVPEEAYEVPLGKAAITREGTDVTIVGITSGVHHGLKAARELEEQGVSVEVVDLRSLVPLDRETVLESVKKTGRLIVVDEDYHSYGMTAEIIASVTEAGVPMKAPPQRVAYPDIPIPFTPVMEQWALPSAEKIIKAFAKMKETEK